MDIVTVASKNEPRKLSAENELAATLEILEIFVCLRRESRMVQVFSGVN